MCRHDDRQVVVRMAFRRKHRVFVSSEVTALKALKDLQDSDVPRLLGHGYTHEGFAYVVTEYIEVGSLACPIDHALSVISGRKH